MNLTDIKLNKVSSQLAQKATQLRQICDHGMIYDYTDFYAHASSTSLTFSQDYVAETDTYDIKLIYSNFGVPNNTIIKDVQNNNDITVKSAIQVGSDIYPVKFNGSDSITIKAGGFIVSDPIGIELKKGDAFKVRNCVSVASLGQTIPLGFMSSCGYTTGDMTLSGTIPMTTMYYYLPNAIVGKTNKPSIFISGDSIASCTSNNLDTGVLGYIARGLNGKLPWGKISRNSDGLSTFVGVNRQSRIQLAKYYTHVICEQGINDIRGGTVTFEQAKTMYLNLWNMYAMRGLKIYQTTITPNTNSTDSWATVENQTILNATANSVRIQLNNWIRTCPAPLSGFFDAADLAETTRNSGIWKAGISVDGLHPNTAGAIALSACIDVAKFI